MKKADYLKDVQFNGIAVEGTHTPTKRRYLIDILSHAKKPENRRVLAGCILKTFDN